MADENAQTPLIMTIGHSTHSIEEFIDILQAYQITQVVDVRTVPRSRRNPQFNRDALPDSLSKVGIAYIHMPELGGLRHPRADSPNMGWHNDSFRGFADYMQTPEFEQNLNQLLELAQNNRTVLMCAEAVPWRCHRSLIGDALLVRGIPVTDIISRSKSQSHKLTQFARVEGTRITYPND